jgi:hypothetical protein
MFACACTNRQQVVVTLTPDGPIESVTVTVQSGDGTVLQDPATPLVVRFVSGEIAGQTVYLVEGDARVGEGENMIPETVELTVAAAEARSLGLSQTALEDKAPATPTARRR